MATKSMRYDHPAYIARLTVGGELGQSARFSFAAFTTMILKSVQFASSVAYATANTIVLYKVSALDTSTATLGTATMSTAMTNYPSIASTTTFSAGDCLAAVSGASDSTGKAAVGVEFHLQPGASVTV